MKLSTRERLLIGAAAAVALFIGLPALLAPAGGRGAGSLEAERGKYRAARERAAALREEIESLQRRVDLGLYPGGERRLVDEVIRAAQQSAKSAGLRLENLKPLPGEERDGLRRVPVQITFAARFPQAARFLFELQRRTRRCRVDQLQMSATNPRSDDLSIELRMVGFVRAKEGEVEPVSDS